MSVPNTFASATSSIPLANLDANFAYYDAAFAISGSAVTFAGSITLTTGTANGVPYLNASKVLTSGAVLTFDGTTLSSTKFAGALNGTVGATTPATGVFTSLNSSGIITISIPGTGIPTNLAVNTTAGAANGMSIETRADESSGIRLVQTSTTYNTSPVTASDPPNIASAGTLVSGRGGGLNIVGANGPVRTYSGGAGTATTSVSSTGLAVTGTLSATGAVTLSGGTANGVAYLDGSKVLTTGSALTFDGTNLTNTSSSVGTPEIAILNSATSAGANARLRIKAGANGASTVGDAYLLFTDNLNWNWSIGAGSSTSNALTFNQYFGLGTNELMRLTSTGLGIGTSSPAHKLDVLGNSARVADSNGSGALLIGTSSGANQYQYVTFGGGTGGTDYGWQVGRSSNSSGLGGDGAFYFYDIKANTTRMSIDSSGNLGLGVTPSAWSSASRPALQLTNGAALFSRTGSTFLGQNFFYNASDAGTYIANGFATVYNQTSGQHQWYNAPSGTAGNAAALTQAMTLNASGELLVGTTNTTPAQSNVAGVAIRPDGISVTGAGALTVNRDSDGIIQSILRSGSLVGNISVTTLLTSYNTTSDYRLKTVSGAVSGQGSRIDALQPIEYTWNSNGSSTRGFLAHQFQEVYPSSVSGDKDAVDADGKPMYQSMQASTSEVIADLVAELQSLRARVAQLESKP